MSTQITAVRYAAATRSHEHIVKVQDSGGNAYDVSTIVQAITLDPHSVFVFDGRRSVWVGVVRPKYGRPYIRTYADGYPTDNLLQLPTF